MIDATKEDVVNLLFLLRNPNQVKQSLGLVMIQAADEIDRLRSELEEAQRDLRLCTGHNTVAKFKMLVAEREDLRAEVERLNDIVKAATTLTNVLDSHE